MAKQSLLDQYLDRLKPVTNTISHVVSSIMPHPQAAATFNPPKIPQVQQYANHLIQGISNFNPINLAPNIAPQIKQFYNQNPQRNPVPTIGQYAQGQIINPIRQGINQFQQPGLLNKGLGATSIGQGVFNAGPGIAWNLGVGGLAGYGEGFRKGQNANQIAANVRQNIANPTSLTGKVTGLDKTPINVAGINVAPAITTIGDLALTRNPKAIIENPVGLKSLKSLVQSFTKSSKPIGKGFEQIAAHHEEALQFLNKWDTAKQAGHIGFTDISRKTADLDLVPQAERLWQFLYGANGKQKMPTDLNRVVDEIRDGVVRTNELIRQGALKRGQKTPVDAMGIAGEGQVKNPTEPYYNVNRVGVDQATQQGIKDTIESQAVKTKVDQVTGKPLTHAEMQQKAQLARELDKNYTRADAEQLGAEALALRQKVADLSELGLNDDQFTEALIRDKAFGTYLARLFGQRRITSNPEQRTLFSSMIGKILKTGVNEEDLIATAKQVDFNDPAQVTAFYRSYIKATPGDWVDLVRYNSMLSSPLTQIVNVSSNVQGTGVITPIQKTIEGTIDALTSAVTGKERKVFAGEGAAYAAGYYGSVKKAWGSFLDSFSGKLMDSNPDTRQIPLATGTGGKIVESALSVPKKALEAFDQFFYTLTKGGLERSNAYRTARGGKVVKTVQKEADELLFRAPLTEEGAGVLSNAIGAGGKWVKTGSQSQNKTIRWTAKLTLPFINIGTNLAKAGVEYNPALGAINMIGNSNKTAQASKMVIGGAVTVIGVGFALQDKLTFAEPTTPKEKEAYRAAHIQPYSIKIGDTWISYQKMHPAISFQLATVAAMTQAWKEGKITEDAGSRIAEGLVTGLQFIADQTYFKNVGDFTNSVQGNVERVGSLLANYPNQAIIYRAGLSWIARMIDHYQRKPDTDASFAVQTVQSIFSQLPGLSMLTPARLGPDGQPIEQPHPLINAVSPARISTENPQGREIYDLYKEDQRITRDNNALSAQVKRQVEQEAAGGNTTAQGQLAEKYRTEIIKERVKSTNTAEIYKDTVYYTADNGDGATLDIGQFSKPAEGIDKLIQDADRLAAARKVYGIKTLEPQQKQYLYQKLGVTAEDAQYDYLAAQDSGIKAKFLDQSVQGRDHNEVLQALIQGRTPSITGELLANDKTLDYLAEVGTISADEAKALKKIDLDQSGKPKASASGKIRKKTAITVSIPKARQVALAKPKRVKQYRLKNYKLKKVKLLT